MTKTFKILSIDGGGIKGIYSAAVLAKLEELSGNKIADCFNLVCGTSTGGLIALLLGAGFSAKEIVQFYSDNAKYIFPPKQNNPIKQLLGIHKFNNANLKNILVQYLGNKKMKDSIINLCIPSIDADNEKPFVFKTGHDPQFTRDPELYMVDIGLATSAAPTYLPKYSLKTLNRNAVDGGLWANNPALVGVIEALTIFFKLDKYNNFALLSVGNIEKNTGCFIALGTLKYLNLAFIPKLIDFFMHIQGQGIESMVNILARANQSAYDRICARSFAPEQHKKIKLDTCNKEVLDLLIGKGYSDAEHYWAQNNVQKYMTTKTTIKE